MFGIAHLCLGFGDVLCLAALLGSLQLGLCRSPVQETGTAKDNHSVLNPRFGLG